MVWSCYFICPRLISKMLLLQCYNKIRRKSDVLYLYLYTPIACRKFWKFLFLLSDSEDDWTWWRQFSKYFSHLFELKMEKRKKCWLWHAYCFFKKRNWRQETLVYPAESPWVLFSFLQNVFIFFMLSLHGATRGCCPLYIFESLLFSFFFSSFLRYLTYYV
jgi:hypothetical protein